MITNEMLTELALDPYLRAAYLRQHQGGPRQLPQLEPGAFDACVGCCDPGPDGMPDDHPGLADARAERVG